MRRGMCVCVWVGGGAGASVGLRNASSSCSLHGTHKRCQDVMLCQRTHSGQPVSCSQSACRKSSGCTACPADHFLKVSIKKCFGRGPWGAEPAENYLFDPTSGGYCAPGDGITVCEPCASVEDPFPEPNRGCAPGACDAHGVCSKCKPGWLPTMEGTWLGPGNGESGRRLQLII